MIPRYGIVNLHIREHNCFCYIINLKSALWMQIFMHLFFHAQLNSFSRIVRLRQRRVPGVCEYGWLGSPQWTGTLDSCEPLHNCEGYVRRYLSVKISSKFTALHSPKAQPALTIISYAYSEIIFIVCSLSKFVDLLQSNPLAPSLRNSNASNRGIGLSFRLQNITLDLYMIRLTVISYIV